MTFWTKEELYHKIALVRQWYGIRGGVDDTIALANRCCPRLEISELEFSSTVICGVLRRGHASTSIALNALRSREQQNFDCGHELIHYFLHDKEDTLFCLNGEAGANAGLEWQANEGAAELIMPYREILPEVRNSSFDLDDYMGLCELTAHIAKKYNVSSIIAENRLDGLKYEIIQYINGVHIDEIVLSSDRKQRERGIQIESLKAKKKRFEPAYDFSDDCW